MEGPQRRTGTTVSKTNRKMTKWTLSLRYLESAGKRIQKLMIQGDT